MKLQIPNDWNGTDWSRFAICWPNSQEWQALLLGFLTFVGRGRAWDENTGIIKDVQAIGQQIKAENYPFKEVALTCQEADLLARTNLILVAALTGGQIDLSAVEDLETVVNQPWAFTSTGLANRLGPEVAAGHADTIQATLERLRVSIETLNATIEAGAGGEDLEDDLAKVWGALDDITEVLGGPVSPAPEPL